MAEASELTRYIESYVDTSRSLSEQAANLDSITSLVKSGFLTVESLVKELEMYLTATDHVTRARGTLLLAEVLTGLALKPLDNATVHHLIGFFADRLRDWRALRGALVGCLVLVKRTSVGVVSSAGAKEVTNSYFNNLQIRALGQHDRKLCFELLECLLERYPGEVVSLGESLISGICEYFEGEKDPHCLMLVFHIIQNLALNFPHESLSSFHEELFEILGCYFPVHFTHKNEDAVVTRDDLSRALMMAFSSTPLFEPSLIPLLLEKLSSSLPSAKVDSLKYLNFCSIKYGAERMAKHAKSIYTLLKEELCTSVQEYDESLPSESVDGLGLQDNEITAEASLLLETLVKQNTDLILDMIVEDEDISAIFNTISSYKSFLNIPLQGKQRLYVVSQIICISAKTSIVSCDRILETFFHSLVAISSKSINFGALYLCTELLEACWNLILCSRELSSKHLSTREACSLNLQSSCLSLISAVCSDLATRAKEIGDVDYRYRVKSLQILATFPEDVLPMSEDAFRNILTTLMSIISVDFNRTFIWKNALKALVQIGAFVSGNRESEKALSYSSIVVERIISLLSDDSLGLPLKLITQAICEIGASGQTHMLRAVQGLKDAIFIHFSDIYVHGNTMSSETAVQLLLCFSNELIPRIYETEGRDDILLPFAVSMWDYVESLMSLDVQVHDRELLDAMMMVMKLTVAGLEKNQNTILHKAYLILSSSTSLLSRTPTSTLIPVQNSFRDELVLSLFASVIIAAHPRIEIPDVSQITRLLLTALLEGHVASAQALGSMINKFDSESEEAAILMETVFMTKLWIDGVEVGFTDLCCGCLNTKLQIHGIIGLSWIGRGLLLRGHERVKDVIMILLDCLTSDGDKHASTSKDDPSGMKTAADAFHILMGDSEFCLNKRFHAISRPLSKQRLFSTVMPVLQSSIKISGSSFSRCMVYRACAHIISDAPLVVVLNEAKNVISLILEGLSIFSEDVQDKDNLYHLLLILSVILTDKKGQETSIENAHPIINRLTELVSYPHMMLVRESAVQCLAAMSELPHARIYPMRTKVLRALSKAVNDRKRAVRVEAVRCRQAWSS